MASLLLGGLKTLGTALLGDLAKQGIETVGQIAKSKLGAFKRSAIGQPEQKSRLIQSLQRQLDMNTRDIQQIKQQHQQMNIKSRAPTTEQMEVEESTNFAY